MPDAIGKDEKVTITIDHQVIYRRTPSGVVADTPTDEENAEFFAALEAAAVAIAELKAALERKPFDHIREIAQTRMSAEGVSGDNVGSALLRAFGQGR